MFDPKQQEQGQRAFLHFFFYRVSLLQLNNDWTSYKRIAFLPPTPTTFYSHVSDWEIPSCRVCLRSWAWREMVMCVQWISGSIRESRLVGLQQIRQAKQIQAAGWSSGALTHIALMCTSLPITLTIGRHISWARRDLHTLPTGEASLPATSCCHTSTLAVLPPGYRKCWMSHSEASSSWLWVLTVWVVDLAR